jgi:subtilase family serine protease
MKKCSIFSYGTLLRVVLVVYLREHECDSVVDHRFTMNSHRQEHLVQQGRAPQDLIHEVVFAVRQKNTENLEAELIERSTPESPKYQQWMTFDEVGNFTSNPVGAGMIKDWLVLNNATVTWESLHNDYIKATAPVQVWEYLFSTEFHQWEDTGRTQYTSSRAPNLFTEKQRAEHQSTLLVLAKVYTIPKSVREHLETAFNTVQVYTYSRIIDLFFCSIVRNL